MTFRRRRHNRPNILLFWSHNDWGRYGRTYEKVAEQLARQPEIEQVICVFPPTTAAAGDHGALTVKRVADNLYLVTQQLAPTDGRWSAVRRRAHDTRSTIELLLFLRLRKGFRKDNTILWLFPPHPYLERLIRIVPHQLVITQVVDNFALFDRRHWLHPYAEAQYPRLGAMSDLIVVASALNHEIFGSSGTECVRFDNAVDETFIATPSPLPFREHGARPRVGYVGWITERTDLALLEYVARARPDWSIVIAGPRYGDDVDTAGLATLPNVQFLGPLPYPEVPAFLGSLDVTVIPHRDTPYSRSMSPLKLYQYLASGRPVVSTPIAGLDRVRPHIAVADSYDAFVHAIARALERDTIDAARTRIAAVQRETWPLRVRAMLEVVMLKYAQSRSPGQRR
ncbi:MAG TPA: glycosyltransferase [Methylomirabilota bacterium]|jgi:glycosyltransferase involved in cell wall biosynthesis